MDFSFFALAFFDMKNDMKWEELNGTRRVHFNPGVPQTFGAREEKENSKGRKNVHNKPESVVPVDVARITPSQRQIHPLFDEKTQLLAYEDCNTSPTPITKKLHDDPLSRRSPLEPPLSSSRPSPLAPATPGSTFHLVPNICVEEGRIEFMKSPSEGSNVASANPLSCHDDKKIKLERLSQCADIAESRRAEGVTRAQETQTDFLYFEASQEKCDFAKERLEAKTKGLQRLLECEKEALQKERLTVARLQRQLARREATQRDVDRERRLRADTESRLRETVSESEHYRETLAGLQREFSKMEDTIRSMLQYKTRCELLNQEVVFLTAIYESRVVQYQNTITKLEQENESLKQRLILFENVKTEDASSDLLERLRSLETENASLFQDADFQRKQYEKCLDDIANQVVRALLSQKGLREEICNLQGRIKELENQNHVLADLLVNKVNKGSVFALPSTDCEVNNERNSSGIFPDKIYTQKTTSGTKFNIKSGVKERLQFGDPGDRSLLKSLSSFESLIFVPLQRPRSLSLQLHATPVALAATSSVTSKRRQSKKGKLNLVTISKKPSEDEGNESPESGNRDEGYSTMSSDVQGLGETNELSKRELEDLKEASDETDVVTDSNGEMTSAVVIEDVSNPDMFFIPLNLSLTINSRQSYPPCKKFLPFQNAMRSFSDSHLCLKLTTSGVSSSDSIFFVKKNPIKEKVEEGSQSSTVSWCSGNWWDPRLFQQWLKLDDTRVKQQQRDMIQLQYDRTEIEEWSMSLSCDDVDKLVESEFSHYKLYESPETSLNMKQMSSSFDEDPNQWNNASNPTVNSKTDYEGKWIEEESGTRKLSWQVISPNGSWCSSSTNNSEDCRASVDCCLNDYNVTESKNIVGIHNDSEEPSAIDTDFTSDFYRLVKYESTKSLASNCSKSNCHCDLGLVSQKQSELAQDREMALQSVLNFIVEQQKYCHNRKEKDLKSQSYCTYDSVENKNGGNDYFCDTNIKIKETNEISSFNNYQEQTQVHPSACDVDVDLGLSSNDNTPNSIVKKKYLLKQKESNEENFLTEAAKSKTNGNSQKLTRHSPKRETATRLPVSNSKRKNSAKGFIKKETAESASDDSIASQTNTVSDFSGEIKKQDKYSSEHVENSDRKEKSENFSSSVITSKALTLKYEKNISKISSQNPSSRSRQTCIPVSTSKKQSPVSSYKQTSENKVPQPKAESKIRGTKIPVISGKKTESYIVKNPTQQMSTKLPKSDVVIEQNKNSSENSENNFLRPNLKKSKTFESHMSRVRVIENSSFHEKASSKDVINELNKIIREGEEITPSNDEKDLRPLDMACCCPTGWVHVERDIDFTDPKARANLLDVMLVSSGSSLGSGSSSDSGGDEPVVYNHLHKLQKFRRQRKEPSRNTCLKSPVDQEIPSPEIDFCTPVTPTTPLTFSDDSDEKTGGLVSLSDSCVESYPDSVGSFEEPK